jgi:hypothetical protein
VKQQPKTLLLWVVLILMFVLIWQFVAPDGARPETTPFSQFMSLVRAKPDEKHVESVEIKDREYTYTVYDPTDKTKRQFKTLGPAGDAVAKDLIEHNVTVRYQFFFFMRQLQAGGGKAMSFGKAKAAALRLAEQGHLRRRGRDRRGQGRGRRDHRLPEGPEEVPAPRRSHPEGRAHDRPAGNRQNPAGPGHRRRGRASLSSPSPARISWRCSWAWARPGPGHVRAGQSQRALHRLHR